MKSEIPENTCGIGANAEKCLPCEKGTTSLLVGAGIGTYGVANYLAAGVVCPFCVIAAPALLGTGIYLRMRHNRKKETAGD